MNDALFDAKLKKALLLAASVDYAEVLSEPEGAEPPWTLPYRRQRKKMLADPNKWCRERVRPLWKKALYRAACVLLAATVTLGSLMAVSPTVRALVFSWIHHFTESGDAEYSRSSEAKEHPTIHEDHPQWRPTWLPEGWVVNGMSGWMGDDSVLWTYTSTKSGANLQFQCCYDSADVGISVGAKNVDAQEVYEAAQVHGRGADYYVGENTATLVWEAEDGSFCNLNIVSKDPEQLSKEFLEQVADSVELYQDTTYFYNVGFVPEGYILKESGRYKEVDLAKSKLNLLNEQYRQKQREYQDLRAETIKVIQGTSRLNVDLLNSLVAETSEQIKQLSWQIQTATAELEETVQSASQVLREYDQLMGWAEMYDNCTFEAKKMIVAQFVKAVHVRRDYEIDIEFNVSFEEFQALYLEGEPEEAKRPGADTLLTIETKTRQAI